MYSNNIVNFQESTTILNACTKTSGNLLNAQRMIYVSVSVIIPIQKKKALLFDSLSNIYILLSTDRLFRCITTLQCD